MYQVVESRLPEYFFICKSRNYIGLNCIYSHNHYLIYHIIIRIKPILTKAYLSDVKNTCFLPFASFDHTANTLPSFEEAISGSVELSLGLLKFIVSPKLAPPSVLFLDKISFKLTIADLILPYNEYA